MPLQKLPQFEEFVALVERADRDAPHRLPLLQQAAPALYGTATPLAEHREPLADRFERWRYQILNNRSGRLSVADQQLVDVLDVAGQIIRGSVRRSAMAIRAAIGSAVTAASNDAAAACLDPVRPLEEVAAWAADQTRRYFGCPDSDGATCVAGRSASRGWRIALYAPLYLSNHCINHCLYCHFRYPQPLDREHLTADQALAQSEILRRRGFRHLLLVAGDFPRLTSIDYFVPIVQSLAGSGFSLAVEVAAQSTAAYARLRRAGISGVTLYQETYQEDLYATYHPRGTKTWFDWRLEALDRAADAGMRRLGLGILLGLADPRRDLRCLIEHGRYLRERYPAVQLAFSLPRIHQAPGPFQPRCAVDDDLFVRMYCALRLAFPAADLVLSTREPPALRDRLAAICITQMSAGSSTAPGGYGADPDSRRNQQFPVCDERSPAEVAEQLSQAGFDVRWELADVMRGSGGF
jgi:2-iminoacetate synthase